MASVLDLPEEIRLLIGKLLDPNTICSCIRVCRSFYSSFIPFLWADFVVKRDRCQAMDAAHLRANSHHVESITYRSTLIEDYYAIQFPRLHTITLSDYCPIYEEHPELQYLQAQFARLNPFVRKFIGDSRTKMQREFWEVVETEWKDIESLRMRVPIDAGSVDSFWRVCDRVQSLSLIDGLQVLENLPILATLSFQQLRDFNITRVSEKKAISQSTWPLQLLQQVKRSTGLRRLDWYVEDLEFPFSMVLEALGEGCWLDWCELSIGGRICSDQDLADILRALTSGRLTHFMLSSGSLGSLTFNCLRELHFDHLRELHLGDSFGVRSEMAQEILTECVNLVTLDTPHIFVRDIATASRPWGCLGLQTLVVYIVKQLDDEDGWDSRVFEQISRLRRLQSLHLQHEPNVFSDAPRDKRIFDLKTLDLRLPHSSSNHGVGNGIGGGVDGGGLSCWSSLVQLQHFSFDGDRQTLGMAEARWMVEHWRNLSWIGGDFMGVDNDGNREQLQLLFRQKDIKLFT